MRMEKYYIGDDDVRSSPEWLPGGEHAKSVIDGCQAKSELRMCSGRPMHAGMIIVSLLSDLV